MTASRSIQPVFRSLNKGARKRILRLCSDSAGECGKQRPPPENRLRIPPAALARDADALMAPGKQSPGRLRARLEILGVGADAPLVDCLEPEFAFIEFAGGQAGDEAIGFIGAVEGIDEAVGADFSQG
jgi:hypothetical protein